MPERQMNSLEVATLLGMDQRRVDRLAERGQLPCQKVAGQFRFNRTEITEWLQQNMSSMTHSHLADMDAGITADRRSRTPEEIPSDTNEDELQLTEIITPLLRAEAVTCDLPARTKNSVLKELVALAQETQLLYDGPSLLEALSQREQLCSTAMEGGIAIPHPRRPQPYIIAEPLLVIARTSQGIGFGSPDGGLTDLFFMTCSLDDRHHLHVLARLCRLLHNSKLNQQLRQATTVEQIIQLIREREAQVVAESI